MDRKEMIRQLERIRKELVERLRKRVEDNWKANWNRDQDRVGAPYGNDNAAKDHVSSEGRNEFRVKGFVNKQKRNNHWYGNSEKLVKRRSEYAKDGIVTVEQYEERALDLVQSSVGGDIVGYKNKHDQVIRYDKKRNDFVKGHPQKGVFTMFKPDDGAEYFERMKKLEAVK